MNCQSCQTQNLIIILLANCYKNRKEHKTREAKKEEKLNI